jgi:hypothetical protein
VLNIFLSYARADGAAAAARLRAELERAGFTVWRDVDDMRGGLPWKDQLRAALRDIDVVLVLLTPRAAASQVVTWEWENALTLQKRVIPLLISKCDVPGELARLHYHDFSLPDQYVSSFAALIRDLVASLPAAPPAASPTPPVTFNVYGANQSAIGPNASVVNYGPIYTGGSDLVQGSERLARAFADWLAQAEALPSGRREEVKQTLEQAQDYAQRLQFGDTQPEVEKALEGRLKRLYGLATDIAEVALTTLISPATGIAVVIQKVAQKVREQIAKPG